MQVVYNIFDQAPEDELFPYCQAHGIAIIARVPFDEGSLTGTLRADTPLARGRLAQPLLHAGTARARRSTAWTGCGRSCPAGQTLPELALRFILQHPAVTTTIPGMRQPAHVRANLAASDGDRCRLQLLAALRPHRWETGLAGALGRLRAAHRAPRSVPRLGR